MAPKSTVPRRRMGGVGVTVAASSSSVNRANRAVGELALRRRDGAADALAPPRRYERAVAVVRPESRPTTTTEFMTPSFAVYAMCGVGCLLGSALSAALLSLIPTLRSVRRAICVGSFGRGVVECPQEPIRAVIGLGDGVGMVKS